MDKIAAVLFDWAGTIVDFGSCAPVRAMEAVFDDAGAPISEGLIRRHMGRAKRDHVAAILAEEEGNWVWQGAHHRAPTEVDIDRLMHALEPAMTAAAQDHADLVPGAAETVAWLRDRGTRIGSTTGYTRAMMSDILPAAEQQGYAPEVVICAGETALGRPAPLMLWDALAQLGSWPTIKCVAVDDAPVGVEAGRNAGLWSVGVAASGNGVGLSLATFEALPAAERVERMRHSADLLLAAGADFVIASVVDLPLLIERIEAALTSGLLPGLRPGIVCF